MKRYGLIGKKLGHSWSAQYFTNKFAQEGIDAQYRLYETDAIAAWLKVEGHTLDGFNVTIPYKQTILPFLDEVDEVAQAIGAVNVVKQDGNRLIGYNTDWIGFRDAIRPLLRDTDQQAVVLGRGGAAKAVEYALKQLGIDYREFGIRDIRQRKEEYQQLQDAIAASTIVVHCTPVGMHPHIDKKPDIPYEAIQKGTIAFDCIYNPTETLFMQCCSAQGAITQNGLSMLHRQAEESWNIWKKRTDI